MAKNKKHVNSVCQIFVVQKQLNASLMAENIGLPSHTAVERDNKSSKYTILLSKDKTNVISLRYLQIN